MVRKAKKDETKKYVVVRTYSAGVHCGYLESSSGREVTLSDAKRIWSWQGANTLHEIAIHGVGKGSKVSEAVEEIRLTEVVEIITCSGEGRERLKTSGWLK